MSRPPVRQMAVLERVTDQPRSIKDIAADCEISFDATNRALHKLWDRALVERQGTLYYKESEDVSRS